MYGFSRGASSADTDGMLIAFATAPVSRKSLICSAICSATFSCASAVAAPRCGVHTTFSSPNSGDGVAGSVSNTSSAAPATCPDSIASASAASSTSPPRAQLMMRTPGLRLRQRLAREDVARGIGQRRVQRDEVGARQQFVELRLLDAEFERALLARNGS